MKSLLFSIVLIFAFSAYSQTPYDSASAQRGSAIRLGDSLAAAPGQQQGRQPQKIKIVKKDIQYSTFVKLAMGMMFFIVLFYATSQTWNPGE
jgi:hypothetical protein